MILDAQMLEGYPNRVMGGLMCNPSLAALCSVPHMSLMMCSCKTVEHTSRRRPHLGAPSPSHARTQLAIRGVYIFCMGGPTSASRRCRAPRTNSPREWGRSRADPEEAVMIKAVIPD